MTRTRWSVACSFGAIIAFGEFVGSLTHVSTTTAVALMVGLFGAGIVIHPSNRT